MRTQRSLVVSAIVSVVMLFSAAIPALAAGSPKRTTPSIGVKAGSVSALLPIAKIYRGYGRNQTSAAAKKGDEVVWNDIIRTEKGGRARITLNDQSVLSLGSQAELKIIKHDARSQQTSLQLGYGRLRAEVASVTRDGGKFELRTPTAVAGVIGTDFGTDSSLPGTTTFICISGVVEVGSSDPALPGTVPCAAGNTVSVSQGSKPTQPKPATPQQIQQLIQDTEPAVITAMSPASLLPGASIASVVSGTKMSGINGVSASGSGVTAGISGAATDTSVTVNVTVAANAQPGPRTITFTKSNGQTSAAVFTVLTPPNSTGALDTSALKKSYDDIIEQERVSEISAINAVLVGVQQSAAQGTDQVNQANNNLPAPLPTQQFQSAIATPVNSLLGNAQQMGQSVNGIAQSATSAFNAAADSAIASNKGASDDAIRAAVKSAFDTINKQLQDQIAALHNGLTGPAVASNNQISGVVTTWLAQINAAAGQQDVPTPKVNGEEKQYEVGVTTDLDASASAAANGASIVSYGWALCSPSYKPQQVGVLIPANSPGCSPISGFASSSSNFNFPTCSLTPQDYIARLTITDSDQRSAAMDVRVKVLQPTYDDPSTRAQNLGLAMQSLQTAQFLSFFDESYSGITALQENIRRTFDSLASMNVNMRVSQASIDCNTATVRADWDQAYTFKQDHTCDNVPSGQTCQRVVFDQSEQLTMRMNRLPGKGWFLTDFQGDSGTVQGVPPGPIQTDTAVSDLQVTDVSSTNGGTGIPPGPYSFTATVANTGTADTTVGTTVHFSLRNADTNVEIAASDATVPNIAHGASTQIQGTINVPDLGTQVNANLSATVDPNCTIAEKDCSNNTFLRPVVVGSALPDLRTTNLVAAIGGTAIPPGNNNFIATVTNVGTGTLGPATNVKFSVLNSTGQELTSVLVPLAVPFAGGATQTVTGTLNIPDLGAGIPATIVANANPGCAQPERNCDAQNIFSLNVTLGTVDLGVSNLRASGPLVGTLSGTVLVDITNTGTRASIASTGNLVLSGPSGVIGSGNIPSINVGQTVAVPVVFIVPNVSGSLAVSVAINPASVADTDSANDTTSGSINITPAALDLQMGPLAFTGAGSPPFLSGQARGVTFTLSNVGNVPTNSADAYTCSLVGVSTVTLGSATLPPIAANGSAPITVNFTVPTNLAGNDSIACSVSHDPNETVFTNNNQSIAAQVRPNINFTVPSAVFPVAVQTGAAETMSVTIANTGLDDAPAGANVIFTLNGSPASTTLGSLAAGASQAVTFNYTAPTVGTPPQDLAVAASVSVNQNGAVTETNTSDNIVTGSVRVVDFTIASLQTSFNAVIGRTANIPALSVGVVSNPYPLPLTISYGALPSGLVASGVNSMNITGTTGGAAGAITLNPSGTAQAITHTASPITLNVFNDFAATQTATPNLAAATGGGPYGTMTLSITGGLYPGVTVTLGTLPSGATLSGTTPASVTLSSSGAVSWSLNANETVSAGTHTVNVTISDNGDSASGVPARSVTVPVTFLVSGNVDNVPTLTMTSSPSTSGQALTANLVVANSGNSASNASDTYSCNFGSVTGVIGSGIPSVPPNGSVTIPLSFNVPIDQYPTANFVCTISADSGETGSALANNTSNTVTLTLTPNYDLAVTALNSLPVALQQGQSLAVTGNIKNLGLDTVPAGWSYSVLIAGSTVFSTAGQAALQSGAQVPVSQNVTVPSPNTAPADATFTGGFSLNVAFASGNDINSANNSMAADVRLVDFTLAPIFTGVTGVNGRSLTVNRAVSVLPATYPLPLTVNYGGAPTGMVGSGTQNDVLSGTPTVTGTFPVTPSATVNGVTRTGASFNVNLFSEISNVPNSIALLQGGAAQTLSSTISGGFSPISVTLGALPSGVTLQTGSATQSITGSGTASWSLAASSGAPVSSGNIVITATDGGVTNTSGSDTAVAPAGNVAVGAAYSVGGQANYQISNAVITSRSTTNLPPVGANAFQVGETVTFAVTVANVGSASPSGPVTVDIACTPSCGSHPATLTNAPGAGSSATTNITLPVNMTPGTGYSGTLSITSAPPQSTTADDSSSPFSFDVFDFSIASAISNPLNVPIGGSGSFTLNYTENPPGSVTLMPTATSADGAAISVAGNSSSATVNINASSVTAAANETLNVTAANFGVSRSTTQSVYYYAASLDFNNGSSILGTDANNPIQVSAGSTTASGTNLIMNGSFFGAANIVLPSTTNGISISSSASTASTGQVFDITFLAASNAQNTPFAITISAQIPFTNPAQTVTRQIWVVAVQSADLSFAATPTVSGNFTGRTFSLTDPLLSGEAGDFTFVIRNNGAAPSNGNTSVLLLLGGSTGQTIGSVNYTSVIPAGGQSSTITLHLQAPDPISDLAGTQLTFWVLPDNGNGTTIGPETNTSDNYSSIAANSSNWNLVLSDANGGTTGPDGFSNAQALVLTPGGSTNTYFHIQPTLTGATAGSNYIIQPFGAPTNHTSSLLGASTGTGAGLITWPINVDSLAPPAPYSLQVQALMFDTGAGAPSSLARTDQLFMVVSGTQPLVTITSDANNAVPGNNTGCTGSCTPVQINGLAVRTLNLTATRSTGTSNTAHVDFVFSDDLNSVISNTDASGFGLNQTITTTYATPTPVNFAAEDNQGSINTNTGQKVVISAAAMEQGTRGGPTQQPVGNQQTTLYFNVGDLAISANNGSCIVLPSGSPVTVPITFIPINGFNSATLSFAWQAGDVNLDPGPAPSPVTYNGTGYPSVNATFTNIGSNTTINSQYVLQVTVNNDGGTGSATEYFVIRVSPNTVCNVLTTNRQVGSTNVSNSMIHGSWRRQSASTGASAVHSIKPAGLPDVQVASKDISFTPSIPTAGDTVNVRFRLTNAGTADATNIPIALQLNGKTVATDTFTVKAGGSALGALNWTAPAVGLTSAQLSAIEAAANNNDRDIQVRNLRYRAALSATAIRRSTAALSLAIVIDPANTMKQASALNKSAALSGFSVRPPVQVAVKQATTAASAEKMLLEIASPCVGYRASSGMPVPCESGNLDIVVEDEGSARYALVSETGNIADIGMVDLASASVAHAVFTDRVILQAGHSYGVQLSDGSVAMFSVTSIVSPRQLTAAMRAAFHQQARKLVSALGGSNGAMEKGQVSGHDDSGPLLYLQMMYNPR